MKNIYNWYNLEPKFKNWLIAGNLISSGIAKKKTSQLTQNTIKNYLSDIRHFLGWLIFKLQAQNLKLKIEKNFPLAVLNQVSINLIEEYKSYLVENKIPIKTTNRRLSTLRKFFSFCIDQGWLKENPAKEVKNINPEKPKNQIEDLLDEFKKDLQKENLEEKTIKSYLTTIGEFLKFVNYSE